MESRYVFYESVTWKISMGKHGTAETGIIAFAALTLDSNCGNVLLVMGGCCLYRAIDKGNI